MAKIKVQNTDGTLEHRIQQRRCFPLYLKAVDYALTVKLRQLVAVLNRKRYIFHKTVS